MQDISKEYIENIKRILEEENITEIKEVLQDLHPADIAYIISGINVKNAKLLFSYLDQEIAPDVLVELDEDIQQNILEDYESNEIVTKFIEEMESDDAADIIMELPDDVKDDVVGILNKSKEEDAQEIIELLDYKEDTAGGLMAKELVEVNLNETVAHCISEIQRLSEVEEIDDIYAVYVVDDQERLKGILSLKQLLLHPSNVKVSTFYSDDYIAVEADTSAEEVAKKMQKYDLVVLPVIDKNGSLLGRITIDDVIDFIKEEADEDYQLASGITEDVDLRDKVWVLSRSRLPWLILGLFGGITSSLVIRNYEDAIRIYPEMAFFIPLITAMAGNAGIQSSAIVVQALANGTLGKGSFFSKLTKELSVAMINALICGSLLLGYGVLFSDSMSIAMTISASLVSVILIASLLGITIPLLLTKLKIDPALATGPFITTSNDLIGLAVYFTIGHLMYNIQF